MKRLFIAFVMLLTLLVATPTIATPAYAGECTILGVCGTIKHYTPDGGLDPAIIIRCDLGDPTTKHNLWEGETSTKYCKDTDEVWNRVGEEIWCKYPTTTSYLTGDYTWIKRFDDAGWHKINDIWDDGWGCTIRED